MEESTYFVSYRNNYTSLSAVSNNTTIHWKIINKLGCLANFILENQNCKSVMDLDSVRKELSALSYRLII